MGRVRPIALERAKPEDEEYAFQIRKAALRAYGPWDETAERALHARRFRERDFWFITADFKPVGLLVYGQNPSGVEVFQLYIEPSEQGRGTGTVCMDRIIEDAALLHLPITLRVMKANAGALRFYLRLGFEVTDETETHHHLTLAPRVPSAEASTDRPCTKKAPDRRRLRP